jgi:hypothetical protein
MEERVEYEEYEDPVTHLRYKIRKITQYIKEEFGGEDEYGGGQQNWDSIPTPATDEYISVDQLPAAMVSFGFIVLCFGIGH